MICRHVNISHGKHMVEEVHSIPAPVQYRSKGRKRMSAWVDGIKLNAQTQTHREEFRRVLIRQVIAVLHAFTWRSRFLEARDQDSLWFVSYVSKRKGGRQVRREKVSFKKKKMTLEQAFFWKATPKMSLWTQSKQQILIKSGRGDLSKPSRAKTHWI